MVFCDTPRVLHSVLHTVTVMESIALLCCLLLTLKKKLLNSILILNGFKLLGKEPLSYDSQKRV